MPTEADTELVTFLIAVIKCPSKSNFRKKEVILSQFEGTITMEEKS